MTNLYFKVYSDGTPYDITYFGQEPSYMEGWFRVVEIYAPGMPDTFSHRLERIEGQLERIEGQLERLFEGDEVDNSL